MTSSEFVSLNGGAVAYQACRLLAMKEYTAFAGTNLFPSVAAQLRGWGQLVTVYRLSQDQYLVEEVTENEEQPLIRNERRLSFAELAPYFSQLGSQVVHVDATLGLDFTNPELGSTLYNCEDNCPTAQAGAQLLESRKRARQ